MKRPDTAQAVSGLFCSGAPVTEGGKVEVMCFSIFLLVVSLRG